MSRSMPDDKQILEQLEQLVRDSIREEKLITNKLLDMESDRDLSVGQRAADWVAAFGGSWVFIVAFFMFLAVWIAANLWWLAEQTFDPFPFILLNLILSCLAAIQAPIIMMSQNRQEQKDRQRARSDYLVNLKAEIEVRSLHRKFDLLVAKEMHNLFEIQKKQLGLLDEIRSGLRGKS